MANDIDMWNDIEELEKRGFQKEAEAMLDVYYHRFIEYNPDEAFRLAEYYSTLYDFNFDFEGYGIN